MKEQSKSTTAVQSTNIIWEDTKVCHNQRDQREVYVVSLNKEFSLKEKAKKVVYDSNLPECSKSFLFFAPNRFVFYFSSFDSDPKLLFSCLESAFTTNKGT